MRKMGEARVCRGVQCHRESLKPRTLPPSQLLLALTCGAALAGDDKDSFSIGLGVLSPSYSQKIGPDGSTKVDFNQEKSGFSYSVSSGEPNAKGSSGAIKPYSHITFTQQFQEPGAKHAGSANELQQGAQHQPPPAQQHYGTPAPLQGAAGGAPSYGTY